MATGMDVGARQASVGAAEGGTGQPDRRAKGATALLEVGLAGSVVSLRFCGTMLTPLLAAALVAVGLGALALRVEELVLVVFAVCVAGAVAGWWLRRRDARRVTGVTA